MLNQQEIWQIFAQTGEPMAYVWYKELQQERQDGQEGEACSSISVSEVS